MLYDLVGILLIIGFSFLFKISVTKGYDEQLIFILLALVIMVIYKYLTYRHMMRKKGQTTTAHTDMNLMGVEPYQDFTDEINDFLGTDVPNGINQGNINEYKSQLMALQDKVDIMNEYLKDLNTRASSTDASAGTPAIGGLDFQAGQQIQDYRIKKMQQDIQRTADLIKQNRLAEDAKKYNKIKVFSSCVVAGADGGYSRDIPSAQQQQTGSSGLAGSSTGGSIIGGTIGGQIPGSGSGSTGLPSEAPVTGSGDTLGAGSGIDINAVLQAIANNGIDVKLS